jgi:acyl-CoA thioester hydrolase
MFTSETELTVRYAETDRMGIVHHSRYAVWFEVGRTEFLRQLGSSYRALEESGINMPLASLGCEFKGTCTYEDRIAIRTRIEALTVARVRFRYDVFKKGEDKPICVGMTELGFTDRTLRPINLKKIRPEIYELMERAFGGT